MKKTRQKRVEKTLDIKDKTYRLAKDKSGVSFMLKTGRNGRLLTFDSEIKRNRAIRHCPNEGSIFIDEQSDMALVDPIIFLNGYLEVDSYNQITQIFLDTHPDNVANGGTWFEEVNDEADAKESIETDELKVDIKQAIRDKSKEDNGIYALEAVVSVLNGSVAEVSKMSKEELKRELYLAVDNDPYYFVNDSNDVTIFENDYIIRKHLVLVAIRNGILKKSTNNKSILWGDTNKIIVTAPVSVNVVDYFTDYLATDDGMLVFDEITKKS